MPKFGNKIRDRGIIIKNCRKSEMIKEYFPNPNDSNTPDMRIPNDERIKLKDNILNPVIPIFSIVSLASKSDKSDWGKQKKYSVPHKNIELIHNKDTFIVWSILIFSLAP